MIRLLTNWLTERRFRAAMRDLDTIEAQARKRNDTRAIGRARKERYRRVHTALGWRGTAR